MTVPASLGRTMMMSAGRQPRGVHCDDNCFLSEVCFLSLLSTFDILRRIAASVCFRTPVTGGNKQRISKSKQKLETSDHLMNPGNNYCGSNSDILSVENEERITVDEGPFDDKIN